MSESSTYEKIIREQLEIDKNILEKQEQDPEDYAIVLKSILEGKEICTTTELLLEKHASYPIIIPTSTPLAKRMLLQRALVIQMIYEKYITPEAYLRVLKAFTSKQRIYFNVRMIRNTQETYSPLQQTRILTRQARSTQTTAQPQVEVQTAQRQAEVQTAQRQAEVQTAQRQAEVQTAQRQAEVQTAQRQAEVQTAQRQAEVQTAQPQKQVVQKQATITKQVEKRLTPPIQNALEEAFTSSKANIAYSILTQRNTAISHFRNYGIPIFDIEATEKTFQMNFSPQEKEQLHQLQIQIADELFQKVRQKRYTIQELKDEKAYIAILPGVLTLNLLRKTLKRFRPDIWFHAQEFAQMPLTPGVILGFGKPFATQLTYQEQKRALLRYSKEKQIEFRPARTCEEIIGWLLDPKAQTAEGMMYTGYTRTMDTIRENNQKLHICVGNFNRGGLHVDKKPDKEQFKHIGISRSYKLLLPS